MALFRGLKIRNLLVDYQHLLCAKNHFIRKCQVLAPQTVKKTNEKKPIWTYDNKGIRHKRVKQLLRLTDEDGEKDESVSHMSRIKKLFTKLDFTCQEIEILLVKKPRIMELSQAKLLNRLNSLKKASIPDDTIKKMILKCPSIILLDLETSLQSKLLLLQKIELTPPLSRDRCIYLVQKSPSLLIACTEQELKKKVRKLREIGFNGQQLYELVMKHPSILTYNIETVVEKVKFVQEVMGGRLVLFIKFPRILSSSLRRIRERYEYLKEEGFLSDNTYLSENKIRAIVLTTDIDFINLLTVKSSRDSDEQFQKKLLDRKLKQYRGFQTKFWENFGKEATNQGGISENDTASTMYNTENEVSDESFDRETDKTQKVV